MWGSFRPQNKLSVKMVVCRESCMREQLMELAVLPSDILLSPLHPAA